MNILEIEKISEYLDGESSEPQEVVSLINSDPELQKVYSNFKVVTKYLRAGNEEYLLSQEEVLNGLWTKIDCKISKDEDLLNKVLNSAFGELPAELASHDVWENIKFKLDQGQSSQVQDKELETAGSAFVSNNWEVLLSESYKLPSSLENLDIWNEISNTLDSQLHAEMFSEKSEANWSDKEKFYMGLSEYFDGEVSTEKATLINDHLLTCPSCRNQYLSLVKLKDALKYSLGGVLQEAADQDKFWGDLDKVLFPSEEVQLKKIQGL